LYARQTTDASGLQRVLDDKGTKQGSEFFFGEAMLDEFNRRPFPKIRVLDIEVISIEAEECHIEPNAVRLLPCSNACACAIPASNRTAKATMSSSP
jgi:hypothetical protein